MRIATVRTSKEILGEMMKGPSVTLHGAAMATRHMLYLTAAKRHSRTPLPLLGPEVMKGPSVTLCGAAIANRQRLNSRRQNGTKPKWRQRTLSALT